MAPSTQTSDPTGPPRLGETGEFSPAFRPPRFGLRTLLLAMFLLCIPLAIGGLRMMRTRVQRDALAQLAPFGVQAGWSRGNVVQLTFRGDAFRDKSLANLTAFPELRRLVLIDTPVTRDGLQNVAKLPLLELRVYGAPELHSREKPLELPRELSSLWLVESDLNDESLNGLAQLSALKKLVLCRTPFTDGCVEKLLPLQQLEEVSVEGTEMTPEGIDSLKRELPKAIIRVSGE